MDEYWGFRVFDGAADRQKKEATVTVPRRYNGERWKQKQ